MRHRAAYLMFLLVLGLLAAACASPAPAEVTPAGMQPAGTQPPGRPVAFDIDPATYVVVDYHRTGGIAGQDERGQLFLDGHVLLERRGQDTVTFQLSQAQIAQLSAAFEAADFTRNVQSEGTPPPMHADARQYEITQRGALLQSTLKTHDGAVPEWAQPLLPLLDNLLLSPPAAGAQPAPSEETPSVQAPAEQAPPVAPIVLVEFVRRQPGGLEDRVLVNVDRTYSVARSGVIEEGELTQEEMAALLKLLETADLAQRKGEYMPEDANAPGTEYELVYRNLFGAAAVRSKEGAIPDWFQAIVATLVDAFIDTSQVASAGTPAASPAPSDESTALPPTVQATATATPVATRTPTPLPINATPAAEPTATVAPTPTLAATPAQPYALADLMADLVVAGARVAPAPGRIVKPYLSTPGTVLRIDGQNVQVFEYDDEATLTADVDGLAADASSIDGQPLTWPAPPHFWRKGQVLVLAVTDDAALVDTISQALGEPFAGQG